jgi:hypothetical protein
LRLGRDAEYLLLETGTRARTHEMKPWQAAKLEKYTLPKNKNMFDC